MFLAVATKIPVVTPVAWALLLAYPLGMIGVLTPYASGQNAVYYGSGYIKRRDFWVLGLVLGVHLYGGVPLDHREVAGVSGCLRPA